MTSQIQVTATTLPAILTPGVNTTCVIFRGVAYVTPGIPVEYYYAYGTSLDNTNYTVVNSTAVHISTGNETAQPVQVCGLNPGQYYYELRAVIFPRTNQSAIYYGGLQPFNITVQVGGCDSLQP